MDKSMYIEVTTPSRFMIIDKVFSVVSVKVEKMFLKLNL